VFRQARRRGMRPIGAFLAERLPCGQRFQANSNFA
jgi:hypothetical protein